MDKLATSASTLRNIIFASAVIYYLHVDSAHAYLDFGTGAIILQTAVAALAGAAVTLKLYWQEIMSFWNKLFGRRQIIAPSATIQESTINKESDD
jgi:hypothetical protein